MRRYFHLNLLAATAIFAAVIVYGSLYPFDFHGGRGGQGPISVLLASWATMPKRGDFLANVVLYAPLGFFGLLATRSELGWKRRLALVLLAGASLSVAMECAQYFDGRRITGARDVYSNVLGTGLGAAAALVMRPELRWPFVTRFAADPIASLILVSWLGVELFPYAPTIDLHKYWDALTPIVYYPRLTAFDLFRYTASWLAVCVVVEAIAGPRQCKRAAVILLLGVLFAKILIIRQFLVLDELAGAAAALLFWHVLVRRPLPERAAIVAAALAIYVFVWRLAPFRFEAYQGGFGWVPFLGLIDGEPGASVQSFFERLFYCGALLWLLIAAGARLWVAAASLAALLFFTSAMQLYLAGRMAEITDAVIVLILAVLIALLKSATRKSGVAPVAFRRPNPVRPPAQPQG